MRKQLSIDNLFRRIKFCTYARHKCCYCGHEIKKGDIYIQLTECKKGKTIVKYAHVHCYCRKYPMKCRYIIEVIKLKYLNLAFYSRDIDMFTRIIKELCEICSCCKDLQ